MDVPFFVPFFWSSFGDVKRRRLRWQADKGAQRMVSVEILRKITERLLHQFHPDRIILFGSQARGIADDRSDVDILVVCPIEKNRRTLMVAMDRALKGLGIARDIVVLSPEEYERDQHIPGSIARPAFLEGKILYERH